MRIDVVVPTETGTAFPASSVLILGAVCRKKCPAKSRSGTIFSSNSGVNFAGTDDYANVFFNPNTHLTGVPVHLSFLSLENFEQGFDMGCCDYNLSNPRLIVGAENSQDEAFFDSYSYLGGGRVQFNQPTILSRAFYTTSRITPTSGFMLLFNDSTTPTSGARNIVDITVNAAKPNFNIFLGAINNGGNVFNASASNKNSFLDMMLRYPKKPAAN